MKKIILIISIIFLHLLFILNISVLAKDISASIKTDDNNNIKPDKKIFSTDNLLSMQSHEITLISFSEQYDINNISVDKIKDIIEAQNSNFKISTSIISEDINIINLNLQKFKIANFTLSHDKLMRILIGILIYVRCNNIFKNDKPIILKDFIALVDNNIGLLSITSKSKTGDPQTGATIFIDGHKEKELTNSDFAVPVGTHEVYIELDKYISYPEKQIVKVSNVGLKSIEVPFELTLKK